MGNHTAGRIIADIVALAVAKRAYGCPALQTLDAAMEQAMAASGFSPDAEFEAESLTKQGTDDDRFSDYRYPHPLSPLGMLLVEAFAPNGLRDLTTYWPMLDDASDDAELEAASDRWWDEVRTPFATRYGLC